MRFRDSRGMKKLAINDWQMSTQFDPDMVVRGHNSKKKSSYLPVKNFCPRILNCVDTKWFNDSYFVFFLFSGLGGI